MLFSERTLVAIVCAMVSTAVCVAQNPVKFSAVTSKNASSSTTGGTPSNIYTADLNNDGVPDIIQDVGNSPDQFTVSIAKGNGMFKPPMNYNYPAGGTNTPRAALAFGDFNGDGNIDLVAAIIGTNILAVYLGNGDGTFQSPKTYPLNLYDTAGGAIGACRMVAIGLNLYLTGQSDNSSQIYVLRGNGNGTFLPAIELDSQYYPITQLVAGDFDGDGIGDIAYTTTDFYGHTRVNVLFLDELGTVNPEPQPEPVPLQLDYLAGFLVLGGGDLDADGRTDLVAIYPNESGSNISVTAMYGRADLTFDEKGFSLPPAPYGSGSGLAPQIVVADFNDDGHMDFAIPAGTSGAYSLEFFLGTGSRGGFTRQTWSLPQYANQSDLVAGFLNRDNKPDVALVQYNSAGDSVITAELNGTAHGVWSNCPYPLQGRGINLCSPTSSSDGAIPSPVNFNAAASSYGQMRDMALLVDGTQLSQQFNVAENSGFLSFTASIAAGAHQGKILATDIDGTQQKLNFNFTVGSPSCAAPTGGNGVNICSPVDGSAASSPEVLVQAAATVSGTLARMEVWADQAKVYTERTSNNLSASIALAPGSHNVTVIAANTAGQQWQETVNVVVPVAQQSYQPQWVQAFGTSGSGNNVAYAIKAAPDHSLYVGGQFTSTATFGGVSLTAMNGPDIFLARYSPSGSLLWVAQIAQISGGGDDVADGIDLDANGNVYLTGSFNGDATFYSANSGGTSINESSGPQQAIFLAKYDPSGNLLWVQTGTSDCPYSGCPILGKGVAVNAAAGTVYLASVTQSDTTFSSADGSTHVISGVGTWQMALAKYDINGNFLWAQTNVSSPNSAGYGVAVDAEDNSYTIGWLEGQTTFSSANGNDITIVGFSPAQSDPNFPDDTFLVKYDKNGNAKWVNHIGGYKAIPSAVAVSPAGQISLVGYIGNINYGSAGEARTIVSSQPPGKNINLGGGLFTNPFNIDEVVATYNSNGVALSAVRRGGAGNESATGLAYDQQGNLYVAAMAEGNGQPQVMVDEYSGTSLLWEATADAGLWVGEVAQEPRLTVDNTGLLYVAGGYANTATFGNMMLSSTGASEAFVAGVSVTVP